MLSPNHNRERPSTGGVGTLLGLIRSERVRQYAPAAVIRRQNRTTKAGAKSKAPNWVRNLRTHCGEVYRTTKFLLRLQNLPRVKIVVPGAGHKYKEIANEFLQAGLESDQIVLLARHFQGWSVMRAMKSIPLAIRVVVRRMFLVRRLNHRTMPYLDVICRYLCLVPTLQRLPAVNWVVIGDISPSLIALAAATSQSQHKLISWQFDFLDFKPFPVPADLAVVLNEMGVCLSRVNEYGDRQESIFWRPVMDIHPLRQESTEAPIGVLLNAFASESVLRRLESLQQRLQRPFLIRLHPNSRIWGQPVGKGWLIAERHQTLEEFISQVGIVICGNTSAQLKALCLGTPVIQLAGLDDLRFDHHGYIERDIVIGFANDDELNLDLVKSFYASGRYFENLRQLVGLPNSERTQNLEKLVSVVSV